MKIKLSKLLSEIAKDISINKSQIKVEAQYLDNEEEYTGKAENIKQFLLKQYKKMHYANKNLSITLSLENYPFFYFEVSNIPPTHENIYELMDVKERQDFDANGKLHNSYPYFYINNEEKYKDDYFMFSKLVEIDTNDIAHIFTPKDYADAIYKNKDYAKLLKNLSRTKLNLRYFKNLASSQSDNIEI